MANIPSPTINTKSSYLTSIRNKFRAMPEVSNTTNFNTSPFETWKSAFRECCKLSSKIIDFCNFNLLSIRRTQAPGFDRHFNPFTNIPPAYVVAL